MGWTGDGATAWEKPTTSDAHGGWLLVRWNGFPIDYGHLVRGCLLPDGSKAGFYREYEAKHTIKHLFTGTIWWSSKPMPEWLQKKGVVYAPDYFTQQNILDQIANDGVSGFGRDKPAFWPIPTEEW